jgi:serine/threonine protein kinase
MLDLEKNKIIHRDLKPANIVVKFAKDHIKDKNQLSEVIKNFNFASDKIQCKIADLGGAKKLGDYSVTSTMVGTPLTMAPEMI